MELSSHEVTLLLEKWRNGDKASFDELMILVNKELYRIAQCKFAQQSPGHTLQATALVNEVYLHLINSKEILYENRVHFMSVCATMMRNILVDHFRRHKRKAQLDEATFVLPERDVDLLMLDEALSRLAAFDQRKSQIVEMRFFGGMAMEEIGAALQISEITVKREWRKTRAWLLSNLNKIHNVNT